MITILTTARHRYTIAGFRRVWGASLSHVINALSYERLFIATSVPQGVFVFTDLDRLSSEDLQRAGNWYQLLVEAGATVLTNPARFVGRLSLLRQLHRLGINQFTAFPLEERRKARFPVFLRFAEGHDGPKSELIYDSATLEAEIERRRTHQNGRQLIVVEFLEYGESDDRFYKFSHFRVGPHLIFCGMSCGRSWCRKETEDIDSAVIEREIRASSSTKHDNTLMQCFEAAGIEFGRIDYAIVGGKIQVFEINTNPDIGVRCPPGLERWKVRSRSYQAFNEALWELHQSSEHSDRIPVPGMIQLRYLVRLISARAHFIEKATRKAARHLIQKVWGQSKNSC